jgi:hypothetical protein
MLQYPSNLQSKGSNIQLKIKCEKVKINEKTKNTKWLHTSPLSRMTSRHCLTIMSVVKFYYVTHDVIKCHGSTSLQ